MRLQPHQSLLTAHLTLTLIKEGFWQVKFTRDQSELGLVIATDDGVIEHHLAPDDMVLEIEARLTRYLFQENQIDKIILNHKVLHRDEWAQKRQARPMILVVAAALIDSDSRILMARRPEGKSMDGLWEFPGGKLKGDEKPEQALIRELKEELNIEVEQSCLAPLAFASHDYDRFHLLMPLYVLRQWQGKPTGSEGQQLKWVKSNDLSQMPMPPADIPLIALLRNFL